MQQRPELDAQQARLADVNWRAANCYRRLLRENPDAIEYVRGRGVDGKTAARFALGFAPSGWRNLEVEFDDYRDSRSLLEADLVKESEKGQRYDRLRSRIVFPIADDQGYVVGFGGRCLSDETPKYLNTAETPLFRKGDLLYGEYQSQRAIEATGEVLVVEGYFDVLATSQRSSGNAVAPMGTALTDGQAKRLLGLAPRVIFVFDGDCAGRAAALRAARSILPYVGYDSGVGVVTLPGGHDPDSLLRAAPDQWESLIAGPTALLPYLVEVAEAQWPGNHAEAKAARARFLVELIALVNDSRVVADALAFVSAELGIRDHVLMQILTGMKAARHQVLDQPSRKLEGQIASAA